jgi:hypothetical protein
LTRFEYKKRFFFWIDLFKLHGILVYKYGRITRIF